MAHSPLFLFSIILNFLNNCNRQDLKYLTRLIIYDSTAATVVKNWASHTPMYHLQFIGITFRKDFTRRRTSMFLTQHNRQTQQSDDLLKYSQLHRDDILSTLQSTDDGITVREANERLHSNGWNIVSSEQLPPWYVQLLTSFHNPFIYVLIV